MRQITGGKAMNTEELRKHAKNIRINIIKEVANANSGHPGGSLGAADILTVLYFNIMDITPENAATQDRDRFVLSKGHCSPLLYAVLAEKGIISDPSELMTFRKFHSRLQGHPDMKKLPGVDMSTGSLGQGISAAVGMAIANKLSKNDHRIYAMCGDGECEEGQVWEAAMAAHHYKLDNLCLVVDQNGLQIDGKTEDVIGPAPFEEKFRAFGWNVITVEDGNDVEQIEAAYRQAMTVKGVPTCIVAHTVKGKGVSFMENDPGWHGKAPNAEQTAIALKDLEAM
jgi:transketolase